MPFRSAPTLLLLATLAAAVAPPAARAGVLVGSTPDGSELRADEWTSFTWEALSEAGLRSTSPTFSLSITEAVWVRLAGEWFDPQMRNPLYTQPRFNVTVNGLDAGLTSEVTGEPGADVDPGSKPFFGETWVTAGSYRLEAGDHIFSIGVAERDELQSSGRGWLLVETDGGTVDPVDPVDPVEPTDPGTTPPQVPEPGTLALAGLGLASALGLRRRTR